MTRLPNPKLALGTEVPLQLASGSSSNLGHLEAHPLQLLIGIFTLTYEQAGCERMGIFKPRSQS